MTLRDGWPALLAALLLALPAPAAAQVKGPGKVGPRLDRNGDPLPPGGVHHLPGISVGADHTDDEPGARHRAVEFLDVYDDTDADGFNNIFAEVFEAFVLERFMLERSVKPGGCVPTMRNSASAGCERRLETGTLRMERSGGVTSFIK